MDGRRSEELFAKGVFLMGWHGLHPVAVKLVGGFLWHMHSTHGRKKDAVFFELFHFWPS